MGHEELMVNGRVTHDQLVVNRAHSSAFGLVASLDADEIEIVSLFRAVGVGAKYS